MYHGSDRNNYNRSDTYMMNRDEKYYEIGSDYFQNTKKMEPPADYGEHLQDEDDVSLDSGGKQKSFIRLCERFAEKTSMQGLPYINAAKLWYAKVLWVIILLGGIAGMTLHLYFLIDQFTDFDVQVSITLGFSNLAFPAVTICNVNAVRHSQLSEVSEKLQSLVAQTDPKNVPPPTGRRKKRYVEDFNIDFDNYTKDYSDRGGEKDQTAQIINTFQSLYMEETRNTRRQIGHQLHDMLLQCSFAGYSCFTQNFTIVQTQQYGNCYTIQSSDYLVTTPGPDNGLSLTLYMETEEYLTGINQGFGARILVHDIDTYPFPSEEGMYVSSSFETHIGLKKVEIKRKDHPYGDCEDVTSYKEQYGATYTRTLCQVLCRQDEIVERCGCFDYSSYDILTALNTSLAVTNHPCRKDTERQCLAEVTKEHETTAPECTRCVNPCQDIQYVKSLSSRNWPTDEYAKVLMDGMCEKIPDKCDKMRIYNANGDITGLSKNFVKVLVYFEDLNYELIEEEPEIESQQFASDVGGAIGLWIGLSMISMFEVVQLLLECCAFAVHKCKHSHKKRSKKYKEKSDKAQSKNGTKPGRLPRPEIRKGNFNSYNNWNNRL